jgi:glycosyltransferase involved in cell wall biosynthesis
MDNPASHPTIFPTRKHYTSPELRRLTGPEITKRLSGTMKLHVFGVPHTITRKDFSTCAFTQKVLKLCAMMHRRGHHVIHYGVEGAEVECTENVNLISHAEWSKLYKHPGTGEHITREDGPYAEYLAMYAQRLNVALRARTGDVCTEILCMTWGGNGQRPGIRGIDQWEVETGIGYRVTWAPYRVFESYAWLHMHLGAEGLWNEPRWYWSVIPNSFDLSDFEFNATPGEDFLYMGRLNADKGVGLAIQVAKEVGRKITIVGPGDPHPFLSGNPHVTYLPPVTSEQRKELMMQAKAVFCPTFYVEPFCGVHIEATLCGTPVITTDTGVFTETVHHGVTGWRCRNYEQFVWAAKNVEQLDRSQARDWAAYNFSLERVALMYEEYFQSILNVKIQPDTDASLAGFYMPNPDRQQLDWLKKCAHPVGTNINLDIPHIPPPPLPKLPPKKEGWEADQDWERNWWGLDWAPHWDEEIKKQETYFRLMGMPENRDFGDKTILDVGCGPVSLLQRSKHGFSRGVDPLAVSAETRVRYATAGVEFLNIKAEEMPYPGEAMTGKLEPRLFDEIWFYNLLQHTDDPIEILRRIVACAHQGTIVRAFEWIDLGVCPGHPQNLTEDMFWKVFGGDDFERPIWNVGALRDFGGTATNKYLAFVAIKK